MARHFSFGLDALGSRSGGQPSSEYTQPPAGAQSHGVSTKGNCPGEHSVTCIDDPDDKRHSWTNDQGRTERVFFIIDAYDSSGHGDFVLSWSIRGSTHYDDGGEDEVPVSPNDIAMGAVAIGLDNGSWSGSWLELYEHNDIRCIQKHTCKTLCASPGCHVKQVASMTSASGNFGNHDKIIEFLEFSGDGATLVTGSASGLVEVWSMKTAKRLKTIYAHPGGEVYILSISPDGRTLATGGVIKKGVKGTKLWELPSGKLLQTLPQNPCDIQGVDFSPDGRTLATCNVNGGLVQLWSMPSGQLLRTVPIKSSARVKYSPDGKILAVTTTDGGGYYIYLLSSRAKLLRKLTGHSNRVWGVDFSPDGKLLASSSNDRTIKLWSMPDGKLLKTLTDHRDQVSSVAFSGDGKILASGSDDNTVLLWSMPSGRLLKTLRGHHNQVYTVGFDPDGGTLASADRDGKIKLWR